MLRYDRHQIRNRHFRDKTHQTAHSCEGGREKQGTAQNNAEVLRVANPKAKQQVDGKQSQTDRNKIWTQRIIEYDITDNYPTHSQSCNMMKLW